VLLNLTLNAIDALTTGTGGRRILAVATSLVPGEGVRVAVRDNGPGVAQEVQARIFEPFVTTKSHGLGLGLAICRSILEAHGCVLNLRCDPGEGAEFSFVLPVTEAAS
jgi:C4-dicarboxylate-specific signal transduction histidine kinase